MHRLLVISCSKRKRLDSRLMPAIDRYDGPTFRVLRCFLREHPEHAPEVLIISAEYGLLSADSRIPFYNRAINATRAKELRPLVAVDFRRIFSTSGWSRIGICLGKQYLTAFSDAAAMIGKGTNMHYLGGGLGKRLSLLFWWLREVPYGSEHRPDAVLKA
jgi:hypothetical protein